MQHLNGNLLCAIDTETTGLVAGKNDLVQICILPLSDKLEPLEEVNEVAIVPFYIKLKPQRPWNINPRALDVNGLQLSDLFENGVSPDEAIELFDEWFDRLQLAPGRRIIPLGQNYPFDRSFLVEWLGAEMYSHYFHYKSRDTMVAALFLNDRASYHSRDVPLPKVNLGSLCAKLAIEHENAHDALHDCLATAEVYRQMVAFIQEERPALSLVASAGG